MRFSFNKQKIASFCIIALILSSINNVYAGITFYDEDEEKTVDIQETKKNKGIDLDALIEAEEKKEQESKEKEAETKEVEIVTGEEIPYNETTEAIETVELSKNKNYTTEIVQEETIQQEETTDAQILTEDDLLQAQLAQSEAEKEYYKQQFQNYYQQYTAATINHDYEYCYGGVWIVEDNHWVFYLESAQKLKNSWLNFNGYMYWLDAQGYMTVGFKFIDGHWYYFNRDGKRHSGWLQYNANIKYYFDPTNGWMAQNDTYVNGQLCKFSADGRLIEDNTQEDIVRLVQAIMAKIQYVNNSKDKTKSHADSDFRDYVRKILQWLPKETLQMLYDNQNLETIYFCMNQGKVENKPYIWRISFYNGETYEDDKGKTVKERSTEDLPFKYDGSDLYVDGSNPETLFFGIGHLLAIRKSLYGSRTGIYEDAAWKRLFNNDEEKDSLMSFSGDRGLICYVGKEDVCLASAIAWYYIDYVALQENCPLYFRFINSALKPAGYSDVGPSTKSNAQLFAEALEDEERFKKIYIAPIAEGELPQLTEAEIIQQKLEKGENWKCSNPDCLKINMTDGDFCRFCGQKRTGIRGSRSY